MTCCRRMPRLLAILAGVGVFALLTPTGFAQSSMPREWIVAEPLTQEQRDGIDDFVDQWCPQLKAGDGTAVTAAREELAAPLTNRQEASDSFVDYYAPQVATCASEALASDRLIVQLNGMILTRRLPSQEAQDLIGTGLGADSAAVRYWAVKVVRHIAVREGWTTSQQRELLESLSQQLRVEPATEVVQQLMLSVLNLPQQQQQARERIIEALNRRVRMHMQELGTSIEAEHAGLTQLYRQLAGGPNDSAAREARHNLARTAHRYMRLATMQLQNDQVPARRRDGYKELIVRCDEILRGIHQESTSEQSPPDPAEPQVRTERWNGVLVIADRWDTILKAEPFNFTDADLSLEPAEEAGADGDAAAGDGGPNN